jgi:hypothetical protein
LPPELKSHALSCALQNSGYKCLKNFLRLSREFADLTKDFLNSSACLKSLVPELLEHNLIKALDVFAHAIENENTVLVRALLDGGITQKLLDKGRYGILIFLPFALYLTPLNLSAVHKLVYTLFLGFCACLDNGRLL